VASRQTLTSEPVHLYWSLGRSPFTLAECTLGASHCSERVGMVAPIIRQARVLPSIGLGFMMVMAMTGCETAQPDKTPHLIMEDTDDTAVPPGQSEPSGPSGRAAPH
jgi:hypothetical protein